MSAPLHRLMKSGLLSIPSRRTCRLSPYRSESKCVYVLLPEVPPDTAETNTLMDTNNFIDWPKVTPGSIYRACGKLAILFETKLSEHGENLKDFGQASSFDDIFRPLEEIDVPLQNAYKAVKHLSTVNKNVFSDAYEGISSHVYQSRGERFRSEYLYHKIKELNSNPSALTESQQGLVNRYLRESVLSGVQLTGQARTLFDASWKDKAKHQDNFRRCVYYSSRIFKHTVYSSTDVGEMPVGVRNRLSLNREKPDEGPWQFGVSSTPIHKAVMEYCPNRKLRKKVWKELMAVGSVRHASEMLSTKDDIEAIRINRKDMAKLLGYNTYTDMVMQHRMAGGVESVMEFIETLRSAFQPEAQEELDGLHKFAASHGFNESMQMWDIDYWSRRQRDQLYPISLTEPSEYFPLNRTLHGLFQICQGLFGVEIKQRRAGDVPIWHPSVLVFDVFDEDGTEKGTFFLDPYTRVGEKYGGGWIASGREKSFVYEGRPTSYLNLNVNPSTGKQPPLLTVKDVLQLFGMMGHTLQQLLTTVEYSEIAGQNNIEWDALHVSSMFMLMWATRPDTLRSLSCHWETNEQLPADQVDAIIGSFSHMYSSRLMKKLFDSAYDLEMHFSERHFDTAARQLWTRYMLQPLDPAYMEPFSMLDVFADDNTASGVYGPLWAEMVAADVMKTFNESTNMDELKATGRRYKNTVLSLGGSVPAIEVFRRFKGHNPSMDSLIQFKLPRH